MTSDTYPNRDTIPAALEHAARLPRGISFIAGDDRSSTLRYEDLLDRAGACAAGLQALGVRKGDRVAIVLPDEKEFVTAFLGASLAGAVGVPMAPPASARQVGAFLEVARRLIERSGARVLVTSPQLRSLSGTLRPGGSTGLQQICCVDELLAGNRSPDRVALSAEDPALLQFTSGSTSLPKGVVLSHGNLAANCHAIVREGMLEPGVHPDDTDDQPLSWLPLFHDMGLIGFVLTPLFARMPVTLMSPLQFLRRPASWLRWLSELRGTITYAPNFAYSYVTKRIHDEQIAGLDLSHVRVFGCGAEPIRAETLRAFVTRFADLGVREEMFVPSYGMAESSLAISFGRGLPVDRVSRRALADHHIAAPAIHKEDELELVGCGKPFRGHALRIVDPDTGLEIPDRQVGEVRIKGPSVTTGYFEDTDATSKLFDGAGWLRTGDLGYLLDGQLFLCGRIKDLIIIRGRNFYPQDIEWAAGQVEGVRKGCVVAFGRRDPVSGADELVLVAERRTGIDKTRLKAGIRTAVREAIGLRVDVIHVAERNTIPKTSSGKLKRTAARDLLEIGTITAPPEDSTLTVAGRLIESQLAHLRHRLFGRRA